MSQTTSTEELNANTTYISVKPDPNSIEPHCQEFHDHVSHKNIEPAKKILQINEHPCKLIIICIHISITLAM